LDDAFRALNFSGRKFERFIQRLSKGQIWLDSALMGRAPDRGPPQKGIYTPGGIRYLRRP